MPKLTDRLSKAFDFARKAHEGQNRKGTQIPYLSHPMGVCSLVLDHGGTEDQAVAGLLHDAVEDCGVTYETLKAEFGEVVARIVKDCTDFDTVPRPPWKERKERYLEHLGASDPRSLLVSASDKLHNALAIVRDVRHGGAEVWKRFSASPAEILWYYESLASVFRERKDEPGVEFARLVGRLGDAVAEMKRVVGGETKEEREVSPPSPPAPPARSPESRAAPSTPADGKNLFIAGLPFEMTPHEIRTMLEGFGQVVDIKVMTDRLTKKFKGYCFVEMKEAAAAKAALQKLNGSMIRGRKLYVDPARPKQEGAGEVRPWTPRPGGGFRKPGFGGFKKGGFGGGFKKGGFKKPGFGGGKPRGDRPRSFSRDRRPPR